MKLSGRYSIGLQAGVVGILAIVAINAFSIPDSLNSAKKRASLAQEADIEKAKAEATKKIADAYAANGIANVNELIVSDYVLNNQPPQIDWANTVDPTKKTFIYDKNRLCVGYALGGRFYFVKYYEGVCENGTR